MQFEIKSDTREQRPWIFPPTKECKGTIKATLKSGDYTLTGLEKIFVVERKASTSEISQNFCQDRFESELIRLEEFEKPFLICCFTLADLFSFPSNSGIPSKLWYKIRITPQFLVKRLTELQSKYKTQFIFAGEHAQSYVYSLFKQMAKEYLDGS